MLLKPLIKDFEIENEEWLKSVIKKSRNEKFEKYSGYLNFNGLTLEEARAAREYLKELCKSTGYVWKPGLCFAIPKILRIAKEILKNSPARKHFQEVVLKNYKGEHFFLLMLSYSGKKFVVNPTGVPVEQKFWVFPDDIQPYFGLVENAKGRHKLVYQNSS